MAHHRIAHPDPRPGCFGCHVLGIGYQGHMSRASDRVAARAGVKPDPTQDHVVIGETGDRAGRPVGKHVEHYDGRQDAHVRAPLVRMKAQIQEGD